MSVAGGSGTGFCPKMICTYVCQDRRHSMRLDKETTVGTRVVRPVPLTTTRDSTGRKTRRRSARWTLHGVKRMDA